MGIAKFLGIGKEIAEPIESAGKVFDNLFTSDDERLSRAEMMEKIKQNPSLWQNALDMVNAQSSSVLIAAARPFCIYVAGLNAFQLGIAVIWFNKVNIPDWFVTMTTTGFLGALGIYGILRSAEKLAGKIK